MTACTNKARGAVVAALAGVLALGAVPAVALATGSDVSLQSVSGVQGIEDGEVTKAVDIENNPVDVPESGVITFTADGEPQAAIPTQVTFAVGNGTMDIDLNEFDYDIKFFSAKDDFTKDYQLAGAPVAAGKYLTELTLTSGYPSATVTLGFEIKAGTVENVTAFDAVDGTFEFDGTNQLPNIKFKVGDRVLDLNDFSSYRLAYREGSSYSWQDVTAVEWAGDYSIVLVGGMPGTPYAGTETEVQFTVTPLDLSEADIVVQDDTVRNMTANDGTGRSYVPTIVSINGKAPSQDLEDRIQVVFKSGPDGSNLVKDRGVYTFTVSPKAPTTQVVESKDVTMVATDAVATDFHYNKTDFADGTINLGAGHSFVPGNIEVFAPNGDKLEAGEYTVTATNAATGETTEDLTVVNTPGTWIINAKVNAEKFSYTLGGKDTMTITTISGEIEADANIYFIYDGKLVSGTHTVGFDGTDKLDDLDVVVTDTYGNVLTEGEDYAVTAYDKAGNKLDEIVDAGTYTIEVTSDSYKIDTDKDALTLQVDPVTVSEVRIADSEFSVYGTDRDDQFIPYTGSAIDPAIEYKGADGKWHSLPSDLYTLTFTYNEQYSTDATHSYEKVDEMNAEGYYKVYLHKSRGYEGNWTIAGGTQGFLQVGNSYDDYGVVCVTADRLFVDVPNNEWYAESIYNAVKLGYMHGDGGTTFFSPAREMNRAEAVTILFNMAGGSDVYPDTLLGYKEGVGFVSNFTDVEFDQFYSKAVAWAEQTGVVNGYADGTFQPARKVSSEEFACMLMNFAKAKGENVAVENADEVIASYPDAESVSDWAKNGVAWAVQEDVMGNGSALEPGTFIPRARVATMIVNYQPDGVFKSAFDLK